MKAIDLTGKRALVTGGSQGIGAEICKKLAECGADIMINHFRSKEKAEALSTELRKTYSVKAEIADADVSNSKSFVSHPLYRRHSIGDCGFQRAIFFCREMDWAICFDSGPRRRVLHRRVFYHLR